MSERPKLRGLSGVDMPEPPEHPEERPAAVGEWGSEPMQVGDTAWFATAWVGLFLALLAVAALWVLALAVVTR